MEKEKKEKLKRLMNAIGDEDDKQELDFDNLSKTISDLTLGINERQDELEDKLEVVVSSMENYKKQIPKLTNLMSESHENLINSLSEQLGKLGGTITTSYEKNKPVNTSGVYKDMINQLSAIDSSIKNKPVPVWNWPQYAAVSVRNKNFSNIDPAVGYQNASVTEALPFGTLPVFDNAGVIAKVSNTVGLPVNVVAGSISITSTALAGLTVNVTKFTTSAIAGAKFDLIKVGGIPFSLDQQVASLSLPVVLTAAQISTLTPLATVAVTQSTSPWVVSGTVTTDTEFPTAATITDNFANPTTTNVMAMGMLWDGATWDRMKGDSTDGVLVNLGANNDVTVTGSVTANAGTNLNTSLLALESGGNLATAVASLSILDDWDESDRAKVNTIAGQVGVQGASGAVTALTQRVVLATDVALPAGTNAIGKLAANSGVDIGDVDVTSIVPGTGATNLGKAEDATHTTGDTGVFNLAVSNENLTAFGAASGDYAPEAVNRYGHRYITSPIPSHASSNGTPIVATTTSVITAPSAGNHLRIMRIHMSNGGATSTWVGIRDGAAGTQHYVSYLAQGAVVSINLNQSGPLDLTTATRLDIVLSAAGSVEYSVDYITVAD